MVQKNSLIDSIVIVGPTASGKSALAIYLAQLTNGEIVSCDSMQIYKHMDIATAKVTKEEQALVKHHMIDIVEPTESYSVSQYINDAKRCIEDIKSRGKLPIICGGTGFYVDAIINGSEIKPSFSSNTRRMLEEECEKSGLDSMYQKLQKIDPDSCEKIHQNDKKRIIRALEIYYNTGVVRSKQNMQECSQYLHPIIFSITMDRKKLYSRINRRVDEMVDNGLIDETKKMMSLGLNENYQSMAGIGYKEMIPYVKGEITLEQAKDNLKQATRRYAKRQITWFKKRPANSIFIDMTNGLTDNIKNVINNAINKI